MSSKVFTSDFFHFSIIPFIYDIDGLDVFLALEHADKIMLTNEKKNLLIENNVPDWYINLEYKCKTCNYINKFFLPRYRHKIISFLHYL